MSRNFLLMLLFVLSACTRKPDTVETLQLPEGFSLSMERFDPRPPAIELVPHDPYFSTENVFIQHPSWKTREAVPLAWSEINEGCRVYQSPTALVLTTKRAIAWRVHLTDTFYWSRWELSLNTLPECEQPLIRMALQAIGHLPYEITDFDTDRLSCGLTLTHPAYSLPIHLTFSFHETATSKNGASIAGGTFVFEELSRK